MNRFLYSLLFTQKGFGGFGSASIALIALSKELFALKALSLFD